MQQNGMRADFSWLKTMPAYLSAYQALRPDVALGRIPEQQQRGKVPVRAWVANVAQGVVPTTQDATVAAGMAGRTRKSARAGSMLGHEASAA